LFSFEDVSVSLADQLVLHRVRCEVSARGITLIMGPSGAGKSTLLRLCNRLEVPTSGRVRYRGDDVASLDPLELRRRVGMVFQRPTPFPGTVRDNLAVADPVGDDGLFVSLLHRVGLPADFLDRVAAELSGGEGQRVCLARSLAAGPEVLLMDEPTSSLDPEQRVHIERLARALADGGMPVLWVTRDLAQARRLDSDGIVLVGGRLASPAEAAAFLAGEWPSGSVPGASGAPAREVDDSSARRPEEGETHD
jgi:putative ABC transport system ATP-binding protein